jgi:hypothetical protein
MASFIDQSARYSACPGRRSRRSSTPIGVGEISRRLSEATPPGARPPPGRDTPNGVRERVGLQSDVVGVTRDSAAQPVGKRNCWPVGPTNDLLGTFPGPLGRAGGMAGPLGRPVGGRCVTRLEVIDCRRWLCSPALSGTPAGCWRCVWGGDRGWSWIGLKSSAWGRSLAWIKNRSPFPCR